MGNITARLDRLERKIQQPGACPLCSKMPQPIEFVFNIAGKRQPPQSEYWICPKCHKRKKKIISEIYFDSDPSDPSLDGKKE